MKTKNIFKALAMAMLMPAMLLTTACSSEDDLVNNTANTENTINKGYALPVTVNVTREGDGATRASYNESTRKLEFTAGDKLFVEGLDDGGAGSFAGTLNYVSGGTFSGTIYTQNEWPGTADALFTSVKAGDFVNATLLPAGYGSYGYLVINTNDPDAQYDDFIEDESFEYTLATSKADGVAQFSYEQSSEYNDGFALSPDNAILNFTITGLAASTSVNVSLTSMGYYTTYNITGTVTTNASGTATFAAGILGGLNLQQFSLTVGGNPITLVSSDKVVEEGKIYNITRGTGATVDLSTKNTNYTAQNGETLTGTLGANVKISIADGATVILKNVNITNLGDNCDWAGINCPGDATLVLEGTNVVCAGRNDGGLNNYPGIWIASNKTLTIQGAGTLTAYSNVTNPFGAGIGGGWEIDCGNIEIQGGTITATGGTGCAGIGAGNGGDNVGDSGGASCGTITISGGTVTATGGEDAAGIGSGSMSSCGNITITSGVTHVTATKGEGANSIGAGVNGTCGTVTIEGGAKVTQN